MGRFNRLAVLRSNFERTHMHDTDWCCRGAVDAGLHVHHFKSAEALREDLVGRGIL